jgi:hypothetical protein
MTDNARGGIAKFRVRCDIKDNHADDSYVSSSQINEGKYRMRGYLPLNPSSRTAVLSLVLVLLCAGATAAQSASAYFAGGTATDSSLGPINTLGAGVIANTPSMGGLFATVGGDVVFFRDRIGIGGEYSFRKSRGPYAGLEYRPVFYDVNAVFYPLRNRPRFAPEIQGGVGRSKLTFYDTPQFCLIAPQGCRSTTGVIETLDQFQIHASGGVRISIWRGLFVRPQVDIRRISKFSDFGSPWVPEYTLAVGYTLHSLRLKLR